MADASPGSRGTPASNFLSVPPRPDAAEATPRDAAWWIAIAAYVLGVASIAVFFGGGLVIGAVGVSLGIAGRLLSGSGTPSHRIARRGVRLSLIGMGLNVAFFVIFILVYGAAHGGR